MSGQRVKLLLDEHIWPGVIDVFVPLGYDIQHIVRAGLRGVSDEDVLTFAARENRAVLTNNYTDFAQLVARWYASHRTHAGVILTEQLPPGELVKRLSRLLDSVSADEIRNSCRWLSEFSVER